MREVPQFNTKSFILYCENIYVNTLNVLIFINITTENPLN